MHYHFLSQNSSNLLARAHCNNPQAAQISKGYVWVPKTVLKFCKRKRISSNLGNVYK